GQRVEPPARRVHPGPAARRERAVGDAGARGPRPRASPPPRPDPARSPPAGHSRRRALPHAPGGPSHPGDPRRRAQRRRDPGQRRAAVARRRRARVPDQAAGRAPAAGRHRRNAGRRPGSTSVIVHLVDGTYELFRYFMSPAAAFDRGTPEALRAVRGVVGSILGMLEDGATHVGVATDHVIESFRNALWAGYKTGEGIDPVLRAQFELLEEALGALGVVVWPMVEHEADDALGTAAAMAAADARVEQVVICTPDKDLAQ